MLLHQLASQSASRLTIINRNKILHDTRRYELRMMEFLGRLFKPRHASFTHRVIDPFSLRVFKIKVQQL